MRLTRYTDYALRVLLYLGRQPEQLAAISVIAAGFGISQSHLMKVVSDLVGAGFLTSVRGRNGGVRLAHPPEAIAIGAVVRHMEHNDHLAACETCAIAPACGLSSMLDEALSGYFAVLDRYSLADALARRGDFSRFLRQPEPA